jgi:hypothetical protein
MREGILTCRRARQRRRPTLHAYICAALVGELHAVRSRGTPTLYTPALELRDSPNEKGNLSGETTKPRHGWATAL